MEAFAGHLPNKLIYHQYKVILNVIEPIAIGKIVKEFLIKCARGSMDKVKSKGDRVSPCLVPRLMSNNSDIPPPTHTRAEGLAYSV